MRWLYDLAYLTAAIVSLPLWLFRLVRTGKIRSDWPGRFGYGPSLPATDSPRILIHAVSVGEVNAIRQLVERLASLPSQPEIVVSTTTNTGTARAHEVFGQSHAVVRYPFDLSWSVNRFLDRVKPDLIALVELEVWPNFVSAATARSIPVCVVNGRLTERSARRYKRVAWAISSAFGKLSLAAVQDDAYAARFRALGVPADRVVVAGTMKWDTARIADHVDGAELLGRELGIDRSRMLVVAGSTAPGEPELFHASMPAGAQLLCAPRKPEWFDLAAAALPGCARRARGECGSATGRFLLDTIGELRKAYALADLVIVGRSFGNLHGSDMMEPAALGKAVVIGPAVADFQQAADALLAGDGIVQTNADQLPEVLAKLLGDSARRAALAQNARRVIRAHQGSTERHAALIERVLATTTQRRKKLAVPA
jgi:3-deoxy-D-manno-octulosonic-acid transferase